MKIIRIAVGMLLLSALVGCASVPMASKSASAQAKQFAAPSAGHAGLYVYRGGGMGTALKKDVFVDGKCLGQTAPHMFFHTEVTGDQEHTLGTESEFSPNQLVLYMKAGVNYFVRQYIKMGVFVGGAGLESVSRNQGKQDVGELDMAVSGQCSR